MEASAKFSVKKNLTFFALLFFIYINLYSQTPQYYNYGTTGNGNSFPLNQAAGKCIQALNDPFEFSNPSPAPSGNITKFYLRIATGFPLGPATYTNLNIIFGQVTLDSLWGWYTTNMDTVYHRASVTLSGAAGTWISFTLDHPYAYNPSIGLLVQIEQCGATGNFSGYSLAHTVVLKSRRAVSFGGCPYVFQTNSHGIPNCGIDITPVNINPSGKEIPSKYDLEQNFPNPFNPVTTISFALPESVSIVLKVYDIMGKEVAVLVNGYKPAGIHSLTFDASSLTSGIYVYKMNAGNFTCSKKMVVVK